MHLWHKEMTLLLLLKCWLFSCWDTHVKNIYFFYQHSRRRAWQMKILIVFALMRVYLKRSRLCSARKMFWSSSFHNIRTTFHCCRTILMLVVEVYKLNLNGYNLQSLFSVCYFLKALIISLFHNRLVKRALRHLSAIWFPMELNQSIIISALGEPRSMKQAFYR